MIIYMCIYVHIIIVIIKITITNKVVLTLESRWIIKANVITIESKFSEGNDWRAAVYLQTESMQAGVRMAQVSQVGSVWNYTSKDGNSTKLGTNDLSV